MIDRWFFPIKLPLTWEQFHQLPQNPAFKYEYFDGTAWLSPRPKFYHGLRTLVPTQAPRELDAEGPVALRPLGPDDWENLPGLFTGAFHRVQPFAGHDDEKRLEAARECLGWTLGGGEGPLIGPACFVATDGEEGCLVGAIIVTLIPNVDLSRFFHLKWKTPPTEDAVEKRLGRAHLTWIFVSPWCAGHGIGSALLSNASQGLLDLGFTELLSTFLVGNTSSMLWHWRNGFQLLPYPGSPRVIRESIRADRQEMSPSRESSPRAPETEHAPRSDISDPAGNDSVR
jgi:hypothetical protein